MTDLVALALLIAARFGLDGPLFCRLVRAESDWNIRAETASSVGLAQINRAAWEWWPDDPFWPATNLAKGAEILKWNLDYWGGDVEKAVASYNLGHGKLGLLIAEHGEGWKGALPVDARKYVEMVTKEPSQGAKFAPQPI